MAGRQWQEFAVPSLSTYQDTVSFWPCSDDGIKKSTLAAGKRGKTGSVVKWGPGEWMLTGMTVTQGSLVVCTGGWGLKVRES